MDQVPRSSPPQRNFGLRLETCWPALPRSEFYHLECKTPKKSKSRDTINATLDRHFGTAANLQNTTSSRPALGPTIGSPLSIHLNGNHGGDDRLNGSDIYPISRKSLLKEICSPLTGMPTNFEFLPGLFRFKGYCDQKATEAYDHDRRVREAIRPPAHEPLPDPAGNDYTGPIDQVQPGDILHSTRYDEYREFMRTKKNITNIKLWGTNEEWIDNHQRPFSGGNINPPSNPFE